MAKTMIAFHGNSEVKKKYTDRVQRHYELDQIIQGTYWENGKGCATGCVVHSKNPHKKYETELGIPDEIAYLEDTIFEGLSNGDAQKFARDFLKAIPVGADLSLVTSKFIVWLMEDLEQYAKDYPDILKAIKTVASLYRRIVHSGTVSDAEWHKVAETARAAGWVLPENARATRATAWATARAATDDARAARAAWAAARAAGVADREAAYKKMANKLLVLLKEIT